ncbi:MAG: galactose mutarotase [Spongiibacteraceae bacterium]|nr:galactose mutarotase [Spongiibacteraceae bacterium]
MLSTVTQSLLGEGELAEPLRLYTLTNKQGMSVQLADLGASLIAVNTQDRDGCFANVLLDYQNPAHYLENPDFFGVTVGRCANRIGQGEFVLDGKNISVDINDGKNHLHGGKQGLSTKRWFAKTHIESSAVSVTFRCDSPDGESGYPGNVSASVTYCLNNDNELVLTYRANTDQRTPLSLTNHAYWNLSASGNILAHSLSMNAKYYLELDDGLIPTGKLVDVSNTAMDFIQSKAIGEHIKQRDNGFDNYWVVEKDKIQSNTELTSVAILKDPVSGRKMEILSTEAGVQFYSGNFLDGSRCRKNGSAINQFAGLCLETHGYPDAVNHKHFPSVIMDSDNNYFQKTVHRFSVD